MALPDSDVVELKRVRATAITRTLADVCARMDLVEGVVVVDAALHSRRVRLSQLTEWTDARRGRPGVSKLKRVIALAEPATESPMESRLRMILVLGGLPKPRVQVPIHDSSGRFVGRPDLYYEEPRLGIEYDGEVHREMLAEDNRRQNRLLSAGVQLLRFTAADVRRNPKSVVEQVRTMLRPYSS